MAKQKSEADAAAVARPAADVITEQVAAAGAVPLIGSVEVDPGKADLGEEYLVEIIDAGGNKRLDTVSVSGTDRRGRPFDLSWQFMTGVPIKLPMCAIQALETTENFSVKLGLENMIARAAMAGNTAAAEEYQKEARMDRMDVRPDGVVFSRSNAQYRVVLPRELQERQRLVI